MLQFPPFTYLRRDPEFPERQFRLQCMTAVLHGEHYDGIPNSFQDEISLSGEYLKLRERRPSQRYNLCKTVVDDSVSMLFSEGHYPAVHCADEATREMLKRISGDTGLNQVMIEAATLGSVGSVAVQLQVLSNRFFFKVLDTQFLTPFYDPQAPDTLVRVRERFKVKGADLIAAGWLIDPKDAASMFWFVRDWTTDQEISYIPMLIGGARKGSAPPIETPDPDRTFAHKMGFVPIVWIKNLPGGKGVDGACTFWDAVETSIEIDYQMSSAGRALKYSADPQLVIKEPSGMGDGDTLVKGAANALIVAADGDAKLLEINGKASAAVLDHVAKLREMGLESIHGNRVSPEKLAAAASGKAMELMNQPLVWLSDRLRISYGQGGLLALLRMVVKASSAYSVVLSDGTAVGKLKQDGSLSLVWPAWYEKTALDNTNDASTLTTLVAAGLMSRERAVTTIAPEYDVEDIPAEMAAIEKEQEAASELLMKQAAAKAPTAPQKQD